MKIPAPKPTLNIPSMTEQLVTKNEVDRRANGSISLFFIIS